MWRRNYPAVLAAVVVLGGAAWILLTDGPAATVWPVLVPVVLWVFEHTVLAAVVGASLVLAGLVLMVLIGFGNTRRPQRGIRTVHPRHARR